MVSVTCPECRATFRVADHFTGVVVTCPRCFGHVNVPTSALSDADNAEPEHPEVQPSAPREERAGSWHYALRGRRYGPVSAREVQRLIDRGEIRPRDLVWRPGLRDWQPASRHFVFDDADEDRHSPPPFPESPPDSDPAGNVCSVLSCIFGGVSFVFLFCPPFFGLVGLILGIVGVSLSRDKTMGAIGIVLSVLGSGVGTILGKLMLPHWHVYDW